MNYNPVFQYFACFERSKAVQMPLLFCLLAMGLLGGGAQEDHKASISKHLYEDDRLRVNVPDGWSAQEATITATGDRTSQSPIGAVLSRGKYRVYLLTHDGQVSGIKGGRFGEISPYVSPWMTPDESMNCTFSFWRVMTPVTNDLERVDLFLDPRLAKADKTEVCKNLYSKTRRRVWYGSYFTMRCLHKGHFDDWCEGFFLPFPLKRETVVNPDQQMVFAASLDTAEPETLPRSSDRELKSFLRDASAIVSSINYK